MYTEFWFCGILFSIVFWLVGRECYLFVKLKVEEWNIQVYERILREEMMLRLSIEAVLQEQGEPEFDAGEQRCSKLGGRRQLLFTLPPLRQVLWRDSNLNSVNTHICPV
ncbi:uncharacterized protein [Drosophila pseudoobscura]|uniref:Uncharacterized protein isoform X17 n=1 Tax=Drosophila pseudoobscura pseudoobscura TaxID=46245 RepID=A0A6I8VFI7_DROPS|nr:uncharacterized protein LOC4804872 isoform X17 [Drosophila pseudoobscura]